MAASAAPVKTQPVTQSVASNEGLAAALTAVRPGATAGPDVVIAPEMLSIDLYAKKLNSDSLVRLTTYIGKNQHVTEVSIGGNSFDLRGWKIFGDYIKFCTHIRILDLGNQGLGEVGQHNSLFHLSECLKVNSSIVQINLELNSFTAEGMMTLAPGIAENKHIKALSLAYNDIRAEGTKTLAKYFTASNNTSITILELRGNKIGVPPGRIKSTTPWKAFTKWISTNNSLTTLDIKENKFDETDFKSLAAAIAKNKSIANLDCSHNMLGIKGAKYLADAIGANAGVTCLSLADTGLYQKSNGANAMKPIAMAVKQNKHIRFLDLSFNKLALKEAHYLRQCLNENDALTSLDLTSNFFEGEAAEHLCQGLITNKTLTHLNLDSNKQNSTGLAAIVKWIKASKSLQELGLSGTLDAGMFTFGDSLSLNESLTAVNLSSNSLLRDDLKSVVQSLKLHPHLQNLSLANNAIGDEGLENLFDLFHLNPSITTYDFTGCGISNAKALEVKARLKKIPTIADVVFSIDASSRLRAFSIVPATQKPQLSLSSEIRPFHTFRNRSIPDSPPLLPSPSGTLNPVHNAASAASATDDLLPPSYIVGGKPAVVNPSSPPVASDALRYRSNTLATSTTRPFDRSPLPTKLAVPSQVSAPVLPTQGSPVVVPSSPRVEPLVSLPAHLLKSFQPVDYTAPPEDQLPPTSPRGPAKSGPLPNPPDHGPSPNNTANSRPSAAVSPSYMAPPPPLEHSPTVPTRSTTPPGGYLAGFAAPPAYAKGEHGRMNSIVDSVTPSLLNAGVGLGQDSPIVARPLSPKRSTDTRSPSSGRPKLPPTPSLIIAPKPIVPIVAQVSASASAAAPAESISAAPVPPMEGEVEIGEVTLGEKIGEGSTTVVYEATWKGEAIAAKVFSLGSDPNDNRALLQQAKLRLSLAPHENVVGLRGFCIRNQPAELWFLLDLMMYSLDSVVYDQSKRAELTLSQIKRYALQVAQGLAYIASSHLVHKRVTAANIFIGPDDHAAIGDFGTDILYFIPWAAPEALKPVQSTDSSHASSDGQKSDVWSFGCLLFELVSGTRPFHTLDPIDVAEKICNGTNPGVPEGCDPGLGELMNRCWQILPQDRPTFEEIVQLLQQQES